MTAVFTLYAGTFVSDAPIFGFDFDGTLAPYRGHGFAADYTAAFLAYLTKWFNIVIISNTTKHGKLKLYSESVDTLTGRKASVSVLAATSSSSIYRKPFTHVWDLYISKMAGAGRPGYSAAFYCGDAAGRPGDFAASDYSFAMNIGATFVTPEAVFDGGLPLWPSPSSLQCQLSGGAAVDEWLASAALAALAAPADDEHDALFGVPTAVIMIGEPGSGKSSWAKRMVLRVPKVRHLQPEKVKASFAAGVSCIVDATNGGVDGRATLIRAAKLARLRCVAVWMQTPPAVCEHLAMARAQMRHAAPIPVVARRVYAKKFVPPSLTEGLDEVICVHMAPVGGDIPLEISRLRYG